MYTQNYITSKISINTGSINIRFEPSTSDSTLVRFRKRLLNTDNRDSIYPSLIHIPNELKEYGQGFPISSKIQTCVHNTDLIKNSPN